MIGGAGAVEAARRLAPYLPRVAMVWADDDPDRTWKVVDGTLVFVDISGFTALSERLAARGAIGAEELTEILSTSFTELLALSYADGGSLLKFGGDALLLLFDGDGHEQRGCRAAIRMRQTMRRVGRLRTTVGAVKLRMSVGVHSGPVHLFRVGASHKELIITGPTASETVTMEGIADAGEIVVSPTTAAAVDNGLIGQPKGPGFLLRDRKQEAVTGFLSAPTPRVDPAVNIPLGLREHLGSDATDSEHRPAAIAFLHFDGTDHLIVEDGPAAAAAALDELVTGVQAAVDDAGVTFLATDIDSDGGKIILVGGVPRAQGDDDGRVLRAVRRIMDTPRALPVRIGAHRGHVFAGGVGPDYRKTYTIMGDAVNLTARLMAKASPGEVYASGSILELSRTVFDIAALEPFYVKGKSKPVQAFALGAATGTQDVVGAGDLPLVGRDEEVSWLTECYDRARTGTGQVVEIVGEVGIGKSRLVAELLAQVSPPTVRTVKCEQYEQSTPLFAAGALLRALLDVDDRGTLDAEYLQALVELPGLERWGPLVLEAAGLPYADNDFTARLGPDERVSRRARMAAATIERLLPAGAVLVVEDVQWLDDASGVIFSRLLRTLSKTSLMCCMTRRAGDGGYSPPAGADVQILSVGPLSEESSAELIRIARIATPMPSHRRKEVIDRAGGNPLFLENLARAVGRHIGDDQPLPDSLEAVVAVELDDLRPEDIRVLGYAAVLGESFPASVLHALAKADGGIDAKDITDRVSALVPERGGRIRFRHRLVRDVAYERLPYRRRKELHRQAGELIERRGDTGGDGRAAVLSFHYFHAGDYERAYELAAVAGRHAKKNSAPVESVELFQRAIAAARRVQGVPPEEMSALWEELSRVAGRIGDLHQMRNAIGEAYRCNVSVEERARHCAGIARAERDLGRPVNALRWVRRGLRLIEDRTGEAAAVARAQLEYRHSYLLFTRGRYLEALEWAERALDSAVAAEDRSTEAHAHLHIGDILHELGRPGGEARARVAAGIYEELGEHGHLGILLNNLGAMNYARGRWPEAVDCYIEARERLMSFGAEVRAGYGCTNAAEIFVEQGRLDDARSLLDEAGQIWEEFDFEFGRAIIERLLGRIQLRVNDIESAQRHLAAAGAIYERYGMMNRVIEIDTLLAECDLRNHSPEMALAALEKVLARETEMDGWEMRSTIHRLMAYAYAALGDVENAWAAVDDSLAVARDRDCPIDVALALEAMASLPGMKHRPSDAEAECARLLAELGVQTRALPPGIRAGAH